MARGSLQYLNNLVSSLKLQNAAKAWEDRHRELSEQIKVYQKSQKDLEDSVAQKAHNIEVSHAFDLDYIRYDTGEGW